VERSLEVISEASRHLPAELKNQMPEIPWRQLADLGNILRHRYFAVDSDIVWMIVQEHLQALRNALIILRNSLEQ
jgi:uncharacterized protein with HEPN domain